MLKIKQIFKTTQPNWDSALFYWFIQLQLTSGTAHSLLLTCVTFLLGLEMSSHALCGELY